MGNERVFFVKKLLGYGIGALLALYANAEVTTLKPTVPKRLLVFYPELREPFAGIYRDFVDGIGQGFKGDVYRFALGKSYLPALRREIDNNPADAMIALGSKSLDALSQIPLQQPVLVSGVLNVEPGMSVQGGILMKPKADIFLAKLLEIHPEVRQIHVVYNAEKASDLISEARAYLEARNMRFNAVKATNVRQAADAYRSILSQANVGDGIWLLSDSRLIDSALLSLVLQSAWEKYLAVFSANPLYVKRGALFAIYPDNVGVGRRLGKMANDLLYRNVAPQGLEPLQDVKLALNTRTSDHLGLRLSSEVRSDVDLFMPDG